MQDKQTSSFAGHSNFDLVSAALCMLLTQLQPVRCPSKAPGVAAQPVVSKAGAAGWHNDNRKVSLPLT
jgi:hypothetical protein